MKQPPSLLETVRAWREKGASPGTLNRRRVVDGKTEWELPLHPYSLKTGWNAATSTFQAVEGLTRRRRARRRALPPLCRGVKSDRDFTLLPNGKGQLDRSYCVHFDGKGHPDGFGEERFCSFSETLLPKARLGSNNRICGHLAPNACFQASQARPQFSAIAMRFAAFGDNLEPVVLYEFSYSQPPGISKSAVLRTADYKNDT